MGFSAPLCWPLELHRSQTFTFISIPVNAHVHVYCFLDKQIYIKTVSKAQVSDNPPTALFHLISKISSGSLHKKEKKNPSSSCCSLGLCFISMFLLSNTAGSIHIHEFNCSKTHIETCVIPPNRDHFQYSPVVWQVNYKHLNQLQTCSIFNCVVAAIDLLSFL